MKAWNNAVRLVAYIWSRGSRVSKHTESCFSSPQTSDKWLFLAEVKAILGVHSFSSPVIMFWKACRAEQKLLNKLWVLCLVYCSSSGILFLPPRGSLDDMSTSTSLKDQRTVR